MEQSDGVVESLVIEFDFSIEVEGEESEIVTFEIEVDSIPAAGKPEPIGFDFDEILGDGDGGDPTDEEMESFFGFFTDHIETWCADNGVTPLGDVYSAVVYVFLALDAEERATDVQYRKYESFIDMEDGFAAAEVLRTVVEMVDLAQDDIGDQWGVTLAVAKDSILRLNVGSRVLMDVRPHDKAGAIVELMILGEVRIPEELQQGIFLRKGFDSPEGSQLLAFPIGNAGIALGLDGLFEAMKAHAQAGARKLPQANWHNPMAELLLLD
jgi:hypothetical protein